MKKIVSLVLLVLITVSVVYAERPKVAVVLAGGGAKGAVHIGVLKVLEEEGVPIDMIVGTSMGAVLGSMYCVGYNADQLDTIISNLNWNNLLTDNAGRENVVFDRKLRDDRFLLRIPFNSKYLNKNFDEKSVEQLAGGGLVEGYSVLNLMAGMSFMYQGDIDFDSLPIPFACVAMDLTTGKATAFRKGNLPTAVRASMAIPAAFTPVEIDGRKYVDGGVVNNFPVDIAKEMGADIVIGVDLAEDLASVDELNSMSTVFSQILHLVSVDKYEKNKSMVDVNIKPDVSNFAVFSFTKSAIDTLVSNGYKAADAMREDISEALSGVEKVTMREDIDIESDTFLLRNVYYEGVNDRESKYLARISKMEIGVPVTVVNINDVVSRLNGSGSFSSITYVAEKIDVKGVYDLHFKLKKRDENELKLGFAIDSEEVASIPFYIGLMENKLSGARGWIDGKISINPRFGLGYSYSTANFWKIGAAYDFRTVDMDIFSMTNGINALQFLSNEIEVSVSRWFIENVDIELSAKLDHYYFYKRWVGAGSDFEMSSRNDIYLSYHLRTNVDTRDNLNFPTKGIGFKAGFGFYHLDFERNFMPFMALDLNFTGAWSICKYICLQPSLYARLLAVPNRNVVVDVPFVNYVGGQVDGRYLEQQIPFVGLLGANYVEDNLLVGRLEVVGNLYKKHYLYLQANYMRTGKYFDYMFTRGGKGFYGVGLKYAYRTPVGPVSIGGFYSDYSNRFGAYASFGYSF